jgi:hypothetical protein
LKRERFGSRCEFSLGLQSGNLAGPRGSTSGLKWLSATESDKN